MPLLAKQLPNLRVQVFGEGEYRRALEERARAHGVADRVVFRGYVAQSELLDTLNRADLGYVGMLCDLMLSNKLVEYVSLGVPAVVARWPTFEYYFPDGTVTTTIPATPARWHGRSSLLPTTPRPPAPAPCAPPPPTRTTAGRCSKGNTWGCTTDCWAALGRWG